MGKKRKHISVAKFKELATDLNSDLREQLPGLVVCRSEPFELDLKEVDGQLTPAISEENKLERVFTISTPAVDRDGDVLDERWELDNFNRGGSVLFGHVSNRPEFIVAAPRATWVESKRLRSRAEFTPREVNPLGHMVFRLIDFGALRGASVGFRPIEFEEAEDRDGFMPMNFGLKELLEYSMTPVPSNPEALDEARSAGIDLDPFVTWAEEVLDSDTDLVVVSKDLVEASWRTVRRKTPKSTITVPGTLTKRVISYGSAHSDGTPKAGCDAEWDGPKEVAAAGVDDLKVMCTWVDSDSSEKKGSYKLPHHLAAGQHPVVWRGVTAAMGALLGARGGVNIPDVDRKGVYDHLAKHYREFGEEPPEFKGLEDTGVSKDGSVELDIQAEVKAADERLKKVFEAIGLQVAKLATDVVTLTKVIGERSLSEEHLELLRGARKQLDELLQNCGGVSSITDEPNPEPSAFDKAFEAWSLEDPESTSLEENRPATVEELKSIANEVLGDALMQLTGRVPDQPPSA